VYVGVYGKEQVLVIDWARGRMETSMMTGMMRRLRTDMVEGDPIRVICSLDQGPGAYICWKGFCPG